MKKIVLTASILIALTSLNAQAPTFQWAKQMASNAGEGHSVAVDLNGNVYTTGSYKATADFDPGTGTFNLTSNGLADIFVSKLDASGNFVWAVSIGSTITDWGYSIALDAAGNPLITGYYFGTVDFDPGAGSFPLTSSGGYGAYVLKLDQAGNFVWVKNIGDGANRFGYGITTDATSNIFITGNFSGVGDFDPGAAVFNLTSAGSDSYVSKLDASGNFVWAKNLGGTSTDIGYAIDVDASGNVYTTGCFEGTADFDPGAGTSNLIASGGRDIFVSKLDGSGNFIWSESFGGVSNEQGNSIKVDASGNVYTTGYFEGVVDFDPGAGTSNLTAAGGSDAFISKLDATGNYSWAGNFGDTNVDIANSLALDALSNVYVTGYFTGTVDFDMGSGVSSLSSNAGAKDVFIAKFDAAGNLTWAVQLGGSIDDYCFAIAVSSTGSIYTTGSFQGTGDFDPGTAVYNLTTGGVSVFVHKLNQGASGISEIPNENSILIYPNPNNGEFNVCASKNSSSSIIEIYNCYGSLVFSQTGMNTITHIDLAEQASGVYFVKVMADNKTIGTQKIIKQ